MRVFLENKKQSLFLSRLIFVILYSVLLFILGNHNFVSAEEYTIEITGASETALSGLPGEQVTGVNDLTITSTCPAGYSVYISGTNSAENNDDFNLYLNGDSTEDSYLVNSNGTIEAATALSENTWGVLADEGVYYGISNNLVSVYNYDGAEENKLLPMTYGANLGANLEAGTYKMANEGGVLYTLLADDNCYNRTLTYDINNGDGGAVPESQSVPYGQTALVATGTQTKTNHGFLGWSEDSVATEPTYIAGDSITMDEDKILYAVWDENYVVTYNSEDGTGATNTVTYQRSCARQSVQNVIQTNDSVTQLLNRSENTLVSMTGNVASATGGAINTISSNYNDDMLEFDVMQFPGATEVRVLLLYDIGEATYDLNTLSGDGVMVYAGAATDVQTIFTDQSNIKTAHTNQTNLYEDNNADGGEIIEITGDTVTIAIQTDGSEGGAGYLAFAIGVDENGNFVPGSHISTVSPATSEIVCTATAVDGTYTAPSRTGYTFSGWSKNSSASRGEYASEGVVKSELGKTITTNPEDLYATWTITHVDYELTLDAIFDDYPAYSGDSPYSSCQAAYGGTCTINLPSDQLEYDNWTFLGWSNSETDAAADYMPGDSVELSGNLTLYAIWEKQITLDYSTEYGETPASETCTVYPHEETCDFTVASMEDEEGYIFIGWTGSDGMSYSPGDTVTASDNFTLTAEWEEEEPEVYTNIIVYDANGGDDLTTPAATSCDTTEIGGCLVTVTEDEPSRTDYIFDGWSTDPDANPQIYEGEGTKYVAGDEIDVDGETILYAVWRDYYIITYETNDPDMPETYVNYSDPISDGSATIMIDSYGGTEENIFEGWTDDPAAETADTATYPLGEEITISSDLTLYGVWTYQPITEYSYRVTVTYDMDGGTGGPEGRTEEGTTRDNYIMNTYCPESTGYEEKEGYEFMGWLDGSGNMVTNCDGMSQLNLWDDTNVNEFTFDYTAAWGAPYTVTFDANGGTGAPEPMQTEAAIPGDYVEFMISDTSSGMEKENTNFLGWDTDPNAATPGYTDNSTIYINEDTILYAIWGDADLDLIYSANGGSGAPIYQTETASGGVATFTVSDQAPYYQGKDFLGWSTDQNATDPSYFGNDTIKIHRDTTLYAVWADPIQIVYHADIDGDNTRDENTVTYNKSCSKVTHSDIIVDPDAESESTILRSLTSNLARAVALNNPDYITSNYNNNIQELDIMYFPGATNINVQVVYDLTGAFDLSTGTGDALIIHPGSPSSVEDIVAGYAAGTTTIISDASNLANYINTSTMAQYNISGEYVTLAMYTDDADTALGYYAIITATDANGNEVFGTHTVTPSSTSEIVCNYSRTAGSYADPSGDLSFFLGWNTSYSASDAAYADESAVISALGNTITTSPYHLYDIWEKYTVNYDGNGADGGDMLDVTDTSIWRTADEQRIFLSTPRYYRSGYGFAGWSTDPNATPGGTSKIYGPNEWIVVDEDFIAADTDGDRTVTLYAIWVFVSEYMQDFDPNSSTYATLPENSVVALLDNRDYNTYLVAKLADGNWWMAENLRLDPNNLVSGASINSTNTNNPTSEFITALENWTTTSYKACNYYTDDCINSLSIDVDNIDRSNSTANFGDGALYNWYTATAGNGLHNMGRDVTATGDICPAGWHLPTGTENGDFATLSTSLGGLSTEMNDYTTPTGQEMSDKLYSFPYNYTYVTLLDGAYTNSSYNQYWSSTAYSGYVSYSMATNLTEVDPTNAISKYDGAPARCMKTVPKYTITYDGNGADIGDMSSASQTNVRAGNTLNLSAPNYIRYYYGFAGWSTDPNAVVGGSSTIYGPNESLEVDSSFLAADTDRDNNITLYAVWVEVESAGALQDFDPTSSKYSSLPVGSMIALIDNRDLESYTVAKLADGKWWMTENLRFDPNSDSASGIDTEYTNNPTSDFVTAVSNWTTTSFNSCAYINEECTESLSIGNWHIDTSSTATASRTGLNQWFGYGAFYNWYTATAGHGLRSLAEDDTTAGDICPAGWRLPTGATTGGDYISLIASLGGLTTYMNDSTSPTGSEISSVLRKFPNNFVTAGAYDGSNGQMDGAFYWTSTARATVTGGTMEFNTYEVTPRGAEMKYRGMPVRCVKQ